MNIEDEAVGYICEMLIFIIINTDHNAFVSSVIASDQAMDKSFQDRINLQSPAKL